MLNYESFLDFLLFDDFTCDKNEVVNYFAKKIDTNIDPTKPFNYSLDIITYLYVINVYSKIEFISFMLHFGKMHGFRFVYTIIKKALEFKETSYDKIFNPACLEFLFTNELEELNFFNNQVTVSVLYNSIYTVLLKLNDKEIAKQLDIFYSLNHLFYNIVIKRKDVITFKNILLANKGEPIALISALYVYLFLTFSYLFEDKHPFIYDFQKELLKICLNFINENFTTIKESLLNTIIVYTLLKGVYGLNFNSIKKENVDIIANLFTEHIPKSKLNNKTFKLLNPTIIFVREYADDFLNDFKFDYSLYFIDIFLYNMFTKDDIKHSLWLEKFFNKIVFKLKKDYPKLKENHIFDLLTYILNKSYLLNSILYGVTLFKETEQLIDTLPLNLYDELVFIESNFTSGKVVNTTSNNIYYNFITCYYFYATHDNKPNLKLFVLFTILKTKKFDYNGFFTDFFNFKYFYLFKDMRKLYFFDTLIAGYLKNNSTLLNNIVYKYTPDLLFYVDSYFLSQFITNIIFNKAFHLWEFIFKKHIYAGLLIEELINMLINLEININDIIPHLDTLIKHSKSQWFDLLVVIESLYTLYTTKNNSEQIIQIGEFILREYIKHNGNKPLPPYTNFPNKKYFNMLHDVMKLVNDKMKRELFKLSLVKKMLFSNQKDY